MQTLVLSSHLETTIIIGGVQNIFLFFLKKNPQWHDDMFFLMDVSQPQKDWDWLSFFIGVFEETESETGMSSSKVILRPKNIRSVAWLQKTKNTKWKKMSEEFNPEARTHTDGPEQRNKTLAPNFRVISFRLESTLAAGRAFEGNGKEFLNPKSKPGLVKFFDETSNEVHSRFCS